MRRLCLFNREDRCCDVLPEDTDLSTYEKSYRYSKVFLLPDDMVVMGLHRRDVYRASVAYSYELER